MSIWRNLFGPVENGITDEQFQRLLEVMDEQGMEQAERLREQGIVPMYTPGSRKYGKPKPEISFSAICRDPRVLLDWLDSF